MVDLPLLYGLTDGFNGGGTTSYGGGGGGGIGGVVDLAVIQEEEAAVPPVRARMPRTVPISPAAMADPESWVQAETARLTITAMPHTVEALALLPRMAKVALS